jgi:Fe-S cluster assembly ATP-binding protein
LRSDVVHVLSRGRIAATGGPELAEELERTGYAAYGEDEVAAEGADPFADPLA